MNESGGNSAKKIILIAAAVVILLVLIINTALMLTLLLKDSETKQDNALNIGVNNSTVSSDTSQSAVQPVANQPAAAPQVQTGQNYTAVSDVESKVKTIRSWYNETQSNRNSAASKGLTRIDSSLTHNGTSYTVEKYYNNGELYFAFAYNGKRENRLYFWNNTMFRWIDESGTTHDNTFGNSEYLSWQSEFVGGSVQNQYMSAQNATGDNQAYESVSDVESKVKTIRSWYNETQSDPSSASSKGLTKKESSISYNGKSYSAEYYYNNGELYFVFAYDGTKENRLYFWNGTLFRWIDENGSIHDNEFSNASFNNWAYIW